MDVIKTALIVLSLLFLISCTKPVERVNVGVGNAPVLGSADASILLVEWSDFECPYCGLFERETFPLIKSKYIDTGKVKVYFRQFPLPFHKDAQKAAEASLCANAQGKFWEYHDKLYNNQEALSLGELKTYAREMGMDAQRFNKCLDGGEMERSVSEDLAAGTSAGVTGTPAFFVNGIPLVGNQPLKKFENVIDKESVNG